MKPGLLIVLIAVVGLNVSAMEITTENGSEDELEAVAILEALRMSHDLSRWEFTDRVHVEARVIPHSHPVLTLNTGHNEKEERDAFLSTYLHEQIHWYMEANEARVEEAIAELRRMYPDVPVGGREGARDEYSAYLHLIVCYLELDATAQLLSEARQQGVIEFWQNHHYTWIYRQVAEDWDAIGEVIERHGLEIPPG